MEGLETRLRQQKLVRLRILKYPIFRSAQTSCASLSESQYAFASRSLWARLVGLSGWHGGRVRGTNGALFGISGSRKRLG